MMASREMERFAKVMLLYCEVVIYLVLHHKLLSPISFVLNLIDSAFSSLARDLQYNLLGVLYLV